MSRLPGVGRPGVGAVIVNYNAGAHLLACVASLRAEGIGDVVVVDNGSADGSTQALVLADSAVRIVSPGHNLGYGAGVNAGLEVLSGVEMVLVGNPDIVVCPGALAALVAAMDADPVLGVVGPRIEEPDGTLYPSARTFPSLADSVGHGFVGLVAPGNRWSRRYKMADWDHASEREVDWISGACFLARREALDSIGGFDPAYFMFSEDVDLCWRAARIGWRVAYQPSATVIHVKGVSVEHHPYRMILAHHRSLLRFAARTTEGRGRTLLPVVAAGLAVRTVLACLDRTGLIGSAPLRRGRLPAGLARHRLGPPRLGPPRLGPPRLGPPRLGPPRLGPPRPGPPRPGPPRPGPPRPGPPRPGPPRPRTTERTWCEKYH